MGRILLVVNMLNDYVERSGSAFCGEATEGAVAYVARLIGALEWDRVVYVCDAHDEDDPEFVHQPAHCVRGSWGAEVTPRLPQGGGAVYVQKKKYSGFFNTGLEDELRRVEPAEVHVVGLRTSASVMDTVEGLYERGLAAVVHRQGTVDPDRAFEKCALERMERLYGVVVRQDEALTRP